MCKFSLDWAERASGQFRSTLCYTISLEALKEGFLKLPTYAAAFSAIEKRAKRRDPLVAAFILFIEYYCSIARGNSDFYGLGAKKLLLNNNLNSWSIVVEACCLRQTSRPNLKRVVSCQHTVWVFLNFRFACNYLGTYGNWNSWEPFWSYQLTSTANPAHLPQKWAKWAVLAVLFSW